MSIPSKVEYGDPLKVSWANDVVDSFNESSPYFEDALEIFAGIKIKYDGIECLNEHEKSEDYTLAVSKFLISQDEEDFEDMKDLMMGIARSYYRADFKELVNKRCIEMYQDEMHDGGYECHIDRDNGESRYLRTGRVA